MGAIVRDQFGVRHGCHGADQPVRPIVVDDQLRAVGLSPQKLRYMRDLCVRVADGSLSLHALESRPDEEVIEALTSVKGIGRWTAEMFLIFRLHRPDVLPVDDLGIVKAVQRAYRLRLAPTPERLTRIGEAWRPYRSVACWYLWASLDSPPPKATARLAGALRVNGSAVKAAKKEQRT